MEHTKQDVSNLPQIDREVKCPITPSTPQSNFSDKPVSIHTAENARYIPAPSYTPVSQLEVQQETQWEQLKDFQ
jgi:hypothetical protein